MLSAPSNPHPRRRPSDIERTRTHGPGRQRRRIDAVGAIVAPFDRVESEGSRRLTSDPWEWIPGHVERVYLRQGRAAPHPRTWTGSTILVWEGYRKSFGNCELICATSWMILVPNSCVVARDCVFGEVCWIVVLNDGGAKGPSGGTLRMRKIQRDSWGNSSTFNAFPWIFSVYFQFFLQLFFKIFRL